jgi:hypothetical protein
MDLRVFRSIPFYFGLVYTFAPSSGVNCKINVMSAGGIRLGFCSGVETGGAPACEFFCPRAV